MGMGGQRHDPAAFTPGKDPVPIVKEAGWAPRPVWIVAENLTPTGIRSPDLPARSESLYRLSCRGSFRYVVLYNLLSNLQCGSSFFSPCKNGHSMNYEGWNFNSGNYLFTTDTK